MPRAGWTKPKGAEHLSDHLAIAALLRAYPPREVDEVIAATDRVEERRRLLPARLVLYYVLAMALFNEASYEEVMRRLLAGLAWQGRRSFDGPIPTKGAIFKGRARLGVEPLAELFRRSVRPLATSVTPGARYRSRRVVALDHLELVLPGLGGVNHVEAGLSPAGSSGQGALSRRLHLGGLLEAVSGVVVDLAVAPTCAEVAMSLIEQRSRAASLLASRRPRALCLIDLDAPGADLWHVARQGGAELLVAAPADLPMDIVEVLVDGTSLVRVRHDCLRDDDTRYRYLKGTDDRSSPRPPLLTTLANPALAPAGELRALYLRRPLLVDAVHDLQMYQEGAVMIPRSKGVVTAVQEVYGVFLAHYAIRALLGMPEDPKVGPLPRS